MEEPGPGLHGSPWSAADIDALLAGVRHFLLHGDKQVPWGWVFTRVRAALPCRSLGAIQAHWRSCRHNKGAAGADDAAGAGDAGRGVKQPWTLQEEAVLRAAVEAAARTPGIHSVNWPFVLRHASPALAGRSQEAVAMYWSKTLSKTAGGLAMLAEVAGALAGDEGGGADAACAPPPPPQQQSPYHMLHGLRSAGAIDERTLRVCWRAVAERCAGEGGE
jgi:hypothetical protein